MVSKLSRKSRIRENPCLLDLSFLFFSSASLSIDERSRSDAIENRYVSFRSVSYESYVYTKIGS